MRVPTLSLALGAAALLCAATTGASAQTSKNAAGMLSIGAGFAGGGSILLDPAVNWKVSPVFAWRTTLDVTYPINDLLGAVLSLGIDRRGGEFYWFDDQEVTERRMVNYFSITPGINIKGLVLALNIGLPMGGARTYVNGTDATERTIALDSETDKLLTMIEPRLSGVIPVLDEKIGWLGVTIGAGYNLSDMSERRDFFPGEMPGVTLGSSTASAHVGITWQFGIPGTRR